MDEQGLSKSEKRMIGAFVVIIVLAMVGITSAVIVGSDDAPIEETAEEIIAAQTGFQVDLTPQSPEH